MDFNGVGQKDAAPSVVETPGVERHFCPRVTFGAVRKQEQEKKTAVKAEGDSSTTVCKKKKKRKQKGDGCRSTKTSRRCRSDMLNVMPKVTSSLHKPETTITEKKSLHSKMAVPTVSPIGASMKLSAMHKNKGQTSSASIKETSKRMELFSSKQVRPIIFSEFNRRWKGTTKITMYVLARVYLPYRLSKFTRGMHFIRSA